MLIWIIAAAITAAVLARANVARPAQGVIGCLILPTIISLFGQLVSSFQGRYDESGYATWLVVPGLILITWFLFKRSKASVFAITIFQTVCALCLIILLASAIAMAAGFVPGAALPNDPGLGVALFAMGIEAIVRGFGAGSGVYYLCTWNRPVSAEVNP
jgi:hypothetical protein